jgi:hypothetical protein
MSRHPGYAADIAEDAAGMVIYMTVHRVERGKPSVILHRQRWQPDERQPLKDALVIAEQAAADDRGDQLATARRHTVKVRAPEPPSRETTPMGVKPPPAPAEPEPQQATPPKPETATAAAHSQPASTLRGGRKQHGRHRTPAAR